jgi:biopolymer transport protein ExbB/TolQ
MPKQTFLIPLILMTSVLLLACATTEEQAVKRREQKIEKENARKNFLLSLSKKCKDYGFKAGTTEFSQCLQQAEQQEILSRSVKLQKKQIEQNEKSLFESMMELENKTRQQLNQK